jgi:quinol monooxygenase YgiN
VEVVPSKREAFLDQFRRLVPEVLAEKGCLFYTPTLDLPSGLNKQIPIRENIVTIVESWDCLESLQAHIVAEHMTRYRERVKDLVVSSQLQVLLPQ